MANLFTMTVSKLNESQDFDYDQLPEASRRYVFQYGLNKSINDAHAAIKRADYADETLWLAAVREPAEKRIEQIRSGNVPGSRGPADPKAAVARELARKLESAGIDLTAIDFSKMSPEDLVKVAKIVGKSAQQPSV